MRDLQVAMDQLIQTINSVGSLSKIEQTHSTTKATSCAIFSATTIYRAMHGACLIVFLGPRTGRWLAGWAASHFWSSVAISVVAMAPGNRGQKRKSHMPAGRKGKNAQRREMEVAEDEIAAGEMEEYCSIFQREDGSL